MVNNFESIDKIKDVNDFDNKIKLIVKHLKLNCLSHEQYFDYNSDSLKNNYFANVKHKGLIHKIITILISLDSNSHYRY